MRILKNILGIIIGGKILKIFSWTELKEKERGEKRMSNENTERDKQMSEDIRALGQWFSNNKRKTKLRPLIKQRKIKMYKAYKKAYYLQKKEAGKK